MTDPNSHGISLWHEKINEDLITSILLIPKIFIFLFSKPEFDLICILQFILPTYLFTDNAALVGTIGIVSSLCGV